MLRENYCKIINSWNAKFSNNFETRKGSCYMPVPLITKIYTLSVRCFQKQGVFMPVR